MSFPTEKAARFYVSVTLISSSAPNFHKSKLKYIYLFFLLEIRNGKVGFTQKISEKMHM